MTGKEYGDQMFHQAMKRIIENSGPINGQRFLYSGPSMRGSLHSIAPALRAVLGENNPIGVAVLVLNCDGEKATICPVIIPPWPVQPEPEDQWLPPDHSPFRVLPGTGSVQLRLGFVTIVPAQVLGDAFRCIPVEVLDHELWETAHALIQRMLASEDLGVFTREQWERMVELIRNR